MSDDAGAWGRLVMQLAVMPRLVERLIAEHRDDGRGRCIRCTVGGRGTPGARWPCGLAVLAVEADRLARVRRLR
jgi:hypothetical protein